MTLVRALPVSATALPTEQSLARPEDSAGVGSRIPAVLLAVLAWAVLLCAGFGGTLGFASQALASKLAAHAQQLQRHAGHSQASRAVRGEQAALPASRQVAEDARTVAPDPVAGALPAGSVTLAVDARRADEAPVPANEPRPKPRASGHPSRAPPSMA